MNKQNNQILSALLNKVDTAWTYIIVCIAILLILVMAGLKAIGVIKADQKEEQKDLLGDLDPLQ